MKQIDCFECNFRNLIPVLSCWYLNPSRQSTAEIQELIFLAPGLNSSFWIINALDKTITYLEGDHTNCPTSEVIDEASAMLMTLTKQCLLFPLPLEKVIYNNAWCKGAEKGFNNDDITSNPYGLNTIGHQAWLDGWVSNAPL